MKALITLNRVRKWEADEIQRDIARLIGEKQDQEVLHQDLVQEITREQELVDSQPQLGRLLLSHNDYFDQAEVRRKEILATIDALQQKIDETREVLQARYRALKTAELLLKNHQEREEKKRRDAENSAMDEIGGQQFQRQLRR